MLHGSLQAFLQCSTLDLILPIKIESATDGLGEEDDEETRGAGVLSFAMDSWALDKYDRPAKHMANRI